MKNYEAVYDSLLVPSVPVYVRIDQRAGHTFTKRLVKPFDRRYMDAMYNATKRIFAETNPLMAYIQSDEASFVYECPEKMPFENRAFKIQSVLASMFSSSFTVSGMSLDDGDEFKASLLENPPSFDCRVCQMPISECANMILWRQRDCIKNSITLAALEEFTTKEIEGKNSEDKISMLAERGIIYNEKYSSEERLGTFVTKESVARKLSDEEMASIPPGNLPQPDLFGDIWVTRNVIQKADFGRPLDEITNRTDVLFYHGTPIYTYP